LKPEELYEQAVAEYNLRKCDWEKYCERLMKQFKALPRWVKAGSLDVKADFLDRAMSSALQTSCPMKGK
jgi:hypothetical protein